MKPTSRRATVALVFALITAAGTSFAEEPGSCCKKGASCCPSSSCCKGTQQKVRSEAAERFRAKYGRELPGTPATTPAHQGCCSRAITRISSSFTTATVFSLRKWTKR